MDDHIPRKRLTNSGTGGGIDEGRSGLLGGVAEGKGGGTEVGMEGGGAADFCVSFKSESFSFSLRELVSSVAFTTSRVVEAGERAWSGGREGRDVCEAQVADERPEDESRWLPWRAGLESWDGSADG